MLKPAEFVGELGGRAACPLQAADRVAGRLVGHQGFDAGDDFRRFFSVGVRPPPARRTRSTSTSRPTSCRRPTATVDGSMPRRVAMRRSPPHPHLSDSSPANSRRWRSSRRLANNTMAARNSLGHQVGVGQGPPESGRGHQQPSGAELMRLLRVVGGAVEELAGELVPRQPAVADELAQGVLGADTEPVVEFVDEVSGFRVVDKRLGGCDEGAGAGEADAGERPQPVLVEVGDLVERIVAAAMGVAGAGGRGP